MLVILAIKQSTHAMVHYEDEPSIWDKFSSLSKNQERPRRNTVCLVALLAGALAGVIVFAVLASITKESRVSCPCANPYKNLGNGERILDMTQCEKDMTYMACYNGKSKQYTTFAGLAGGSGGLFVVSLLMYRYG